MASTSADVLDATGEYLVRPRPRKPLHSQLSQISNVSETNGTLEPPSNGHGTGSTSGRSTPVPLDAPPSVKSLSTARKQVRAEQRRRLFPTIEFASRVSHFDPNSDYRDFRGFFNLFWIGLAIMAITSMLRNIKDTGYPLRVEIWSLFTVKLWHLAIADFLMVATTAVSLPLQHLVRAAPNGGRLTWAKGGMAIMSVYQVLWLAFWIAVPFLLGWTWTSQVFFLLHTMVLLMKMHSYVFYNGHLSETEKRLRSLDDPSTASRGPVYLYPTPDNPMGTMASPKRSGAGGEVEGDGEGKEDAPGDSDEIAQLREDLARELTSPIGTITYPANLTWPNYVDYICCPTLCYEIEYPRNDKIDWQNLFSKIAAIFGCIFLLTIISEEFILPALVDASQRLDPALRTADSALTALEVLLILAETISWLLFPFMLTFLLVFLVIFEYVLGACAEITRFADRHFYSDWWNSTDWMEFSREWNVPVYSFLRRHVYSASRPHIGKANATVITFLISALGHEIVMACITKKLRGYGFICQMLQLPIVMLQRTKWVRGRKTFNNVCFWCSMILGLSLICSLYVLV
ncbi:MBOAT, membrane-bound O-acyltransferase family-domain-containing protein [Chaetomium tenue]|uniref:MBOAT, membrane-bound O-acyltransferase family-domain-containing protein n=1 Tax=Chaetomium tenue TaxID=1854479 RepID=A0ACB7PHG3_9PEZI|nr:MBOAT, membrane-bound O-acyltransferase family-domain-containing protein [Chaetomium globosum]